MTPDPARVRAFYEQVDDNIARFGQHIQGVGGGEQTPSFCYTVGNRADGYADLLLIGFDFSSTAYVLNTLAKLRKERGREFDHLEVVRLHDESPPLRIVDVPGDVAQREYTFQASRVYGTEDYAVKQVLLSDEAGRLPGDPGCAEPFASMEDLSKRRVVH